MSRTNSSRRSIRSATSSGKAGCSTRDRAACTLPNKFGHLCETCWGLLLLWSLRLRGGILFLLGEFDVGHKLLGGIGELEVENDLLEQVHLAERLFLQPLFVERRELFVLRRLNRARH